MKESGHFSQENDPPCSPGISAEIILCPRMSGSQRCICVTVTGKHSLEEELWFHLTLTAQRGAVGSSLQAADDSDLHAGSCPSQKRMPSMISLVVTPSAQSSLRSGSSCGSGEVKGRMGAGPADHSSPGPPGDSPGQRPEGVKDGTKMLPELWGPLGSVPCSPCPKSSLASAPANYL